MRSDPEGLSEQVCGSGRAQTWPLPYGGQQGSCLCHRLFPPCFSKWLCCTFLITKAACAHSPNFQHHRNSRWCNFCECSRSEVLSSLWESAKWLTLPPALYVRNKAVLPAWLGGAWHTRDSVQPSTTEAPTSWLPQSSLVRVPCNGCSSLEPPVLARPRPTLTAGPSQGHPDPSLLIQVE